MAPVMDAARRKVRLIRRHDPGGTIISNEDVIDFVYYLYAVKCSSDIFTRTECGM
jgi:hypothetical protein